MLGRLQGSVFAISHALAATSSAMAIVSEARRLSVGASSRAATRAGGPAGGTAMPSRTSRAMGQPGRAGDQNPRPVTDARSSVVMSAGPSQTPARSCCRQSRSFA